MAKVAREMVERASVDVEQLLELLVRNAAAKQAGKDLTEDLAQAPHGLEFLERFPVVGVISD